MKKMIGVVAGLLILIGLALPGQAKADSQIVNFDSVVSSGGFPVKIYSDAACTQYTNTNLSIGISEWKTFRSLSNGNGTVSSYDLGNNQWVKSTDVFLGGINRVGKNNPMVFNFAYSANKKVPVYNSPQLSEISSYLSTSNSNWKITGYALHSESASPIDAVDLGNNQWVSAQDVNIIRLYSFFASNTQLYNLAGQTTSTITQGAYKILGATTINGETYVKLGNDSQWAKFSAAFNQ